MGGRIIDIIIRKFGDGNIVIVQAVIIAINGLSILVSQLTTGIVGQMVCGSMFGFTFGGYVTGIIIILKKIFNDLSTSLGLLLFCCAISSISGPVVVGAIFDKW